MSNHLPKANPDSLRQTALGAIIGFSEATTGSQAWHGIPYAKAPIDDRRWKSPQPLTERWDTPREAIAYGPQACQQALHWEQDVVSSDTFTGSSYIGSEDCLYLNLWSPPFIPEAVPQGGDRLPVMVWIHGGGDIWGSGELNDGGHLAVKENIILVSFNYRLGAFGWLSHPALRASADNNEEASGNFGTLDMIQALRWVQDNISAFGGDPGCVTIFGCSAGAWNVLSLLESPLAQGLFHRAIVQGGWPRKATVVQAEHYYDDPEPGHPQSSKELLVQLVRQQLPTFSRAQAKAHCDAMTNEAVVDYLKQQSYEQLERAYLALEHRYREDYYTQEKIWDTKLGRHIPESSHSVPKLFCDGTVLPLSTIHKSIAHGNYNAVPVMLGTNRDESSMFQVIDPAFVSTEDGKRVIHDPVRYALTNDYVSKLWQRAGADEIADALTDAGNKAVYVYQFNWDQLPTVNGEDLNTLYGAAHGMECSALFYAAEIHGQPPHKSFYPVSAAIMSYWAQFARSGNPGQGSSQQLSPWLGWKDPNHTRHRMVLGSQSKNVTSQASEVQDYYQDKQALIKAIANDSRLTTNKQRLQLLYDIMDHAHTYFSYADYLLAAKAFQ